MERNNSISFGKNTSYCTDVLNRDYRGNFNSILLGYKGRRSDYIGHNLLHSEYSQIVVDFSDDLYKNTASYLKSLGCNVSVLNLQDPENSSHYNPLYELYDNYGEVNEVSVDALCDQMCRDTYGAGANQGVEDPYYIKCYRAIYKMLICYITENDDIPREDKNFMTLYQMVRQLDLDEFGTCEFVRAVNDSPCVLAKEAAETVSMIHGKTLLYLLTSIKIYFEGGLSTLCALTQWEPAMGADEYVDLAMMTKQTSYLFIIGSEKYRYFLNLVVSQIARRLCELAERQRVQYILSEEGHSPLLYPFGSEKELNRFMHEYKEDPEFDRGLIRIFYINGYFQLIWDGKVIQTSQDARQLKALSGNLKNAKTTRLECGFSNPVLMYINNAPEYFDYHNLIYPYSTCRRMNFGIHLLFDRDRLTHFIERVRMDFDLIMLNTAFCVVLSKEDVVGDTKDCEQLRKFFHCTMPLDTLSDYRNRGKIHIWNADHIFEGKLIDALPNWLTEDYREKWIAPSDKTQKSSQNIRSIETSGPEKSYKYTKENQPVLQTFQPDLITARNEKYVEDHVSYHKKELVRNLMHMHPVFKENTTMPAEFGGYFVHRFGKIEDMRVDYAVCPVNYDLSGGAQVAAAIFKCGGDKVLDGYKKAVSSANGRSIQKPFIVSSTDTGLKCSNVCFTPMDDKIDLENTDDIYRLLFGSYYSVFSSVEKHGTSPSVSIAFPLLGTGAAGYPAQLSAEAALNAFIEYRSHMQYVENKKNISVVLLAFHEKDYKSIEDAIRFYAFKNMMIDVILNSEI